MIGLSITGCKPKKPQVAGRFENYKQRDCSNLKGCDQMSCVIKECWCITDRDFILFESGLTIENEKDAQSVMTAYFEINPDQASKLNEIESYDHNWYILYYEEDAFTVGPDGKLYLIDCI